jgi:hypothetical protein
MVIHVTGPSSAPFSQALARTLTSPLLAYSPQVVRTYPPWSGSIRVRPGQGETISHRLGIHTAFGRQNSN